jgi:hypothetical protein
MRTLIVLLLLASPAFADYPYDAVGNVSAGGSGTMVYVDGDYGLVVTSAHVVATVSETNVTWSGKKRLCKTVFVDYENDIAILLCRNPPVKAVPYREPVGNFIVSTGYPYYSRSALHWQASIALRMEGSVMWVTHRPVAGMSGGGAFDFGGYFIGIVRSHNQTDGGIVAGESLTEVMEKYKDSKTWLPSAVHVQVPQDYDFSPQDGHVRSIRYSVDTAPELPWPGK